MFGEVSLDDAYEQVSGEVVVLVLPLLAASDGGRNTQEHAARIDVDEELKGLEQVVRDAWVTDFGQTVGNRAGLWVEALLRGVGMCSYSGMFCHGEHQMRSGTPS